MNGDEYDRIYRHAYPHRLGIERKQAREPWALCFWAMATGAVWGSLITLALT